LPQACRAAERAITSVSLRCVKPLTLQRDRSQMANGQGIKVSAPETGLWRVAAYPERLES
jgi:hypothetical protein